MRRFELRLGSGGRGRFRGGDGVVRELLFREEALLSVLTERRAFRPYGLHGEQPRSPAAGGPPVSPPTSSASPIPASWAPPTSPLLAGGEPGARGLNLLIRKDGRTVNLGGKTSVPVYPGVRVELCPLSFPPAPIDRHSTEGEQSCKDDQTRSLIWFLRGRGRAVGLRGPVGPVDTLPQGQGNGTAAGGGVRGGHARPEPAPLFHRTCSASTHQAVGATGTRMTPPRSRRGRLSSPRPSLSAAASMSTAEPRRRCEGGPPQ